MSPQRQYFNNLINSYVGTYEVTHGEIVGLWFKNARNSWITRQPQYATKFAWCAAFIYSMLKRSGKEPKYLPTAETVRAKSYIPEGFPYGLLKALPVDLDQAKKGDIIVLKRGSNKYHVGTYNGHDSENIIVRGGNQNNKVKDSLYPIHRLVSIADFDSI